MRIQFTGVGTALVTPFRKDGSLDEAAIRRLARRQIDGGVHFLSPVGTTGVGGAFSFYPTKNLAALGDAGAVITNDRDVADRIRRMRNGGQQPRHHHVEQGVNSRLDELQAAVLRVRLRRLDAWNDRRRAIADRYRDALGDPASGLWVPTPSAEVTRTGRRKPES